MPKWKLSDPDAKSREAAFEAKVLAELAAATPKSAPPPIVSRPAADGIQISVTASGQTTRYDNLESVPLPLRQRIMNTWLGAPQATFAPPMIVAPAAKRRSRRTAVIMNLFLPGAGQFYIGQPGWGTVYALSFIACFVPMVANIMRAMQTAMSGDILDAGRLEKIGELLQPSTIGILGTLQLVIMIVAIVHVFRSRAVS